MAHWSRDSGLGATMLPSLQTPLQSKRMPVRQVSTLLLRDGHARQLMAPQRHHGIVKVAKQLPLFSNGLSIVRNYGATT